MEDSANDVTSGVLQRSILGLLLFVIYVNGLPEVVRNTFFLLVDNIKLFSRVAHTVNKYFLMKMCMLGLLNDHTAFVHLPMSREIVQSPSMHLRAKQSSR